MRDFLTMSAPEYGTFLNDQQFMKGPIKALHAQCGRIAGPAYTVQLASGDHLMLHAAIYEAPPGSILVVDAVDDKAAVAGGNVCAIAQQRGIQGLIVQGVIRDLGDVIENKFPVFAHGVYPVPGKKKVLTELNQPVVVGQVNVFAGDIVIADHEGIVVLPKDEADELFDHAQVKLSNEQSLSLEAWRDKHRATVEAALAKAVLKP